MKLLVDMNLSPEWLGVLSRAGWQAAHWSTIGSPKAKDAELLAWARDRNHVVLTQDLDFGQVLYQTQAVGPSIVMLRVRNELDPAQQTRVCEALQVAAAALESGALLVIDERRARLRRLPIQTEEQS